MNWRNGITFVLLMAVISIKCVAAGTYLGAGGATCAYWAEVRRDYPAGKVAVELWLLGYVSGLNFALYSDRGIDLLENQSRESVLGFVEGYCATNPGRTLNNAANEYWVQRMKAFAR